MVIATSLWSRPCFAASEEDRQHAIALFEQSEDYYKAGELEKSRDLLLEAYALDANPVLQYNLGRVYEGLGQFEKAAEAFRAFLEGTPNAPDRGAIERRIATLERQVREREAMREERERKERERERERQRAKQAPKPEPVREPMPDPGPGAAPWVVTGIGAAVLVGGAVAGVLSSKAHDDAVADPTFQGARDSQDRAETYATVANVGFVAGGATVAVGLSWLLFGPSGQPDANAAAPWRNGPGPLVIQGRF